MQRILLTGMSGTGKSTLTAELARRGYKAIDADCDAWSHWVDCAELPEAPGSTVEPDRDWVWRADRIRDLLASEDVDTLFVSGCAVNMVEFYPQFDHIVLLTAPTAVIVQRLATRTNNPYGKRPEEVARVLQLFATIEPRLRRRAGHVIDTSVPLDEVVRSVLRIV
ncbi:MAG: AAA family ATPase [Planctomycetes bacterium]|nr:AAA family ATPase [Planctomycetota bacterium]